MNLQSPPSAPESAPPRAESDVRPAAASPGGAYRSRVPGRIMIVVENRAAFDDHRVTKQIETLIQRGYHVYVITMRHPSNRRYSADPLVHLYEYPAPPEPGSMPAYFVEYGYSFFAAAFLAFRVAVRERIDVVQFCQPPDIYFPLAGMLRKLGVRVVVLDQRDLLPELYVARYGSSRRWLISAIKRLERRSQRNADRIITVSEYFQSRLLASSGVPADRVSIVGNGPVLRRVEGAEGDPELKRGRRYLCCWVGVVARQDRVDLLVRSIDHLVHELGRKDCQFVIIGYGDFLAEAKALVVSKDLTEWVRFTGQVDQAEVFRYLATADVGLDASLQHEVSPVKAIEYMAFGLPFVAFDLPGTRAISDGAASYVEPGDVVAHARAIDALLRNAKRRRDLGKAGQARVREELAWDHQALTYLRLMDQLCLNGART